MKTDVKVPQAGESISEGDIARWFKADGDLVALDDPLLELETDKASLEVPSPADGRLNILAAEGETVLVGQVIATVDAVAQEEKSSGEMSKDEAPAVSEHHAPAPEKSMATSQSEPPNDVLAEEPGGKKSTRGSVDMPSPAARQLIADHQISARDITGTGKAGRITKGDVLEYVKHLQREKGLTNVDDLLRLATEEENVRATAAYADMPNTALPPPLSQPEPAVTSPGFPEFSAREDVRPVRAERMSRIRRTIAQRMVEAQHNAALLSTFNEVDMTEIMDIRKVHKDDFQETHGVKLGIMSFFIKAAAIALKQFPNCNASVDEDQILYHDFTDIGIAVATSKGLVVPVIRDADKLAFHEIEQAINDYALRGRNNKLTPNDLDGGTFTITNGGVFGSMLSTPIVKPPQSAILGMHKIAPRPVVVDGEVAVRPIMYLAVTYDHRIIDGAEAVTFLVRIRDLLEQPVKLFLDM